MIGPPASGHPLRPNGLRSLAVLSVYGSECSRDLHNSLPPHAGAGHTLQSAPEPVGSLERRCTMRKLILGSTLLLLFACDTATEPDEAEITLQTSSFAPSQISVTAGTEVTWVNGSAINHTITPEQHTQWERREMSNAGERFTVLLDTPGTYRFYCEQHQDVGMEGTIIVTP